MFSFPLILISNLMIIFSKSFFFMWMIMEINLIGFISILMMNKFIYMEKIMIFFLIQSFNSHMFFMSNLMMNFNLFSNSLLIIIFFSILSKMGMPPFHLWYLNLMKSLNWMIFFFNSSIQKFIPLMILNFYMIKNLNMFKFLIMLILIISSIIPLYSINTLSLKLIMSFSAMIQISWIMMMMLINELTWIIYFFIYNFISFSMYYIFFLFNINYTFNMNLNNLNNKIFLYFISLQFLSLAGLPPFTGFLNKWLFINISFNNLSIYLNSIILISSLLNLFYYIRTMIQISVFFYLKNNFKINYMKYMNFMNLKISLIIMNSLMMLMFYEFI
uniref:NADH dehydrogenase subunit 2 n=1 Tax=Anagyrus galinae TaxID=3085291 RepID=UPI002A7FD245|nr:NADH dehydrogenase subunit 2 [Anagyrus galinae]WON65596.1 NADH dehydrogenase subunit 2 [Anagyrus galinae]